MNIEQQCLNATYYYAGASKAQAVNIFVSSESIQFVVNEESFSYNLCDTQLAPPLAKLPREIHLADGGKLVLEATVAIDQYYKNTHYLWLYNIEKHKKFYLFAFLLVPLFLVCIFKFVIPSFARNIAPLLPVSVLQQIDEQALYAFDKTILNESLAAIEVKNDLTKNWNKMVNTLQLNAEADNNFTLLYRESDVLGANAFALPGGTVVITDGLINLLKDKPEAIQAILLHEIGHVVHHHGMQMMAESISITLLTTYLFGDLEGIAETFNGLSASVIQNSFSQSLEAQADDYALSRLKKLNISPHALADAFIALSKEFGGTEEGNEHFLEKYYSSHPSIKSRIEKAKL